MRRRKSMKQLLAVFTAAVIGTTGIVPAVAAADYEPGTEEIYYEEDSVYFEDPAEEDLTYFEEDSFSEEDTEGAALPDSFAEGEEMTDEEEYAPEETEESEIQYEEENDEIVGAVNQKASSDAEAPEIIDVFAEDSESVPEDAEVGLE